jgi:hypothetical protein
VICGGVCRFWYLAIFPFSDLLIPLDLLPRKQDKLLRSVSAVLPFGETAGAH